MINLKERSSEKELMDDLECTGEELQKNLDELEIINQRLGGYHLTLSGLEKLLSGNLEKSSAILSIADIGCGGGDGLRILSEWAKSKGIKVQLIGIDANAFMIDYATRKSIGYKDITYKQMDIFSKEYALEKFDIITFSLFCHHFEEEQLVQMLKNAVNQSEIGIIINDLHRHFLAYYSIKYITQWFSKSILTRNDAPLSVARGFKKKELVNILRKAGIKHFTISWKWAFRYRIVIFKNPIS